jgi:hypothetical protein
MAEEDSKNLINLEKHCEQIFGITSRRYRQLAKDDPSIPEPVKGMVNYPRSALALINHYRQQCEARGDLSLTEERKLKVKTDRQLKEIELMIKRGELIPRDQVLNEFLSRISAVKTGLLGQHKILPPLLIGLEPRDMADVIKKANFHLLDRFSRKGGISRLCGKDAKKPVVARRKRPVAPAGGDDGEPVRRPE